MKPGINTFATVLHTGSSEHVEQLAVMNEEPPHGAGRS